jgi:hypothetical protein
MLPLLRRHEIQVLLRAGFGAQDVATRTNASVDTVRRVHRDGRGYAHGRHRGASDAPPSSLGCRAVGARGCLRAPYTGQRTYGLKLGDAREEWSVRGNERAFSRAAGEPSRGVVVDAIQVFSYLF